MVGNDGISLYNGNSFRRPWQQQQQEQKQKKTTKLCNSAS
jgi:hypothetical protein